MGYQTEHVFTITLYSLSVNYSDCESSWKTADGAEHAVEFSNGVQKTYGRIDLYKCGCFVLLMDVGYCLDVYSNFTGVGDTYVTFPNQASLRLLLSRLADEATREKCCDRYLPSCTR